MGFLPFDATTLLGGGIVFVIAIWYFRQKRQNLPPGPTPLPLVGNLISVARAGSVLEALENYRRQYGNIYTLYFGSHPTVVLCGQKMIREALITNADLFSDRPTFLTLPKTASKNTGIVWDPHKWRDHRKNTLVTLKDFGLGRNSLEERVCNEARALCEHLETMEGEVVDMRPHLTKAFSNVMCTVVFGERFEYDNPRFTHLLKLLDYAFSVSGSESAILDHVPWLIVIPKFKAQFNEFMEANRKIEDYIKEIIEEHKQSFDSENLRDFIDLYLKSDPTNEQTAMSIIKELFFAGTETSGTTLSWALMLMAKYPEIQDKCLDEIQMVIGKSRRPQLADRGNLPYTEATIQEIMRYISIAPITLPHIVSEDTTFAGYHLQKNMIVFPYLDSCHHDPEVWPDHNKFRPERWLDASGKFDPKNSSFMPFSVGRRSCLGEQLAKMELFIMFVSVIQQFEFSPAPGKPVSLEGHLGVTYAPVDARLTYRCHVEVEWIDE